ncbi:ABC transporter permease [candidate division KSB1 bacterium]|nr:ABC transporter permease [candidate division KSB1 bacterium]
MKAVAHIALHTLRVLSRDRTAAIWMLFVPLLFIAIFGSAFRSSGDPAATRAYLAVWNRDGGIAADRLLAYLESENLVIVLLDSLPESSPPRYLEIPAGLSDSLATGKASRLLFWQKSDANREAAMTAELAVRKALYRLLADLGEVRLNPDLEPDSVYAAIDRRPSLIRVDIQQAGRHRIIPSGYAHQTPGNLVMFTLLFVLIYGGTILQEERRSGALRRIAVAPLSLQQIFAGKWLGLTVIALLQMILLLIAGRTVFGVYYGSSPAGLFWLISAFATVVAGMALCLAFWIESEEKLTGTAIVTSIVLAALGGCWFPLEVAPQWMNTLASILPSGMAMKAFHRLISFGESTTDILPYLGGLAIYAIVFGFGFVRLVRQRVADIK